MKSFPFACSLILFAVVLPASAAPKLGKVLIRDVPHIQQRPDFCGEACAAMFLNRLGKKFDQNDVFNYAGLSPLNGRGCYTRELTTALKNIGFDVGPVWTHINPSKAKKEIQAAFTEMHRDLATGVPSIVCMHYSDQPKTTEHFRLVLGFDPKSDEVIYHEPAEKDGAYRRMKREEFVKLWPLKYSKKKWNLIRFPLALKKRIEPRVYPSFSPAEYAQHVRKLKARLPGNDFHVVLQPPFVVVGDEALSVVKRRAEGTVKWSVDKLKKDYFSLDPSRILDVWLFKDEASYRKHTWALFKDKPNTPYGYYSREHNALIMNIRTGGGTLVHEIVHPFMETNIPNCASWFNEGLASLYEQSHEREGRIIGLTNWRLAGLQKAIKKQTVPAFETLCSTTTNEFYREDPGTNYSQARYLCYYLQEKDLLHKFFHLYRKRAEKDDPSGYKTLQEVLGTEKMDAFKKDWEAYVLKLRFGR